MFIFRTQGRFASRQRLPNNLPSVGRNRRCKHETREHTELLLAVYDARPAQTLTIYGNAVADQRH